MKTRLELLQNKGYWIAFLEGMKHDKEPDDKIAEEIVSRIESLSKTTPIQRNKAGLNALEFADEYFKDRPDFTFKDNTEIKDFLEQWESQAPPIQAESEWIKWSDRLPTKKDADKNEEILALFEDGLELKVNYNDSGIGGVIIKWKSIPTQIESVSEEVEKLLAMDQSWSLVDVLKKLVEATHILLHERDYDGHGWELMEKCHERGNEIIELLNSKNGLLDRLSQTTEGWISVDDRLPEKREDVLWGCVGEDKIYRERYLVDMLEPYYVGAYTHWMPLPHPPDKKEKEENKPEGSST